MSEPTPSCADLPLDADEHDWEWIRDWYGDPGVINGTADCSRWECKNCRKVDEKREMPSYEDEWEDYRHD